MIYNVYHCLHVYATRFTFFLDDVTLFNLRKNSVSWLLGESEVSKCVLHMLGLCLHPMGQVNCHKAPSIVPVSWQWIPCTAADFST